MELDAFLRDARSRRSFFRLSGVSLAGGTAVFLAACGGDDDDEDDANAPVERDTGAKESDLAILNSALDLELMAVAAYKAGSTLLRGEVLEAGQLFLAQEQEHADGLSQAIRDIGGSPNKPKPRYDFPRMRSQTDVLRFAVELERTAVAAYVDALPKLSGGDLRATAASIATNEAEHISVLLDALGENPVPDAFVSGKA